MAATSEDLAPDHPEKALLIAEDASELVTLLRLRLDASLVLSLGFLLIGAVVVYCVLIVLFNFLADIALCLLDPRVKLTDE